MAYYITNDKNYLMRNSTGQLTATSDFEKAYKFISREKASNVINSLPKPLKHLGYYIKQELLQYEEYFEAKQGSYTQNVTTIELEETMPSFEKIISIVKEFENLLKDMPQKKTYLEDKLTTIEKAIIDVEHSIEFFSYNACEGYKIYRKLKDLRIERRKIKDSLLIISILSQPADPSNLNMYERISNLLNRSYEPRVLKELFGGKANDE